MPGPEPDLAHPRSNDKLLRSDTQLRKSVGDSNRATSGMGLLGEYIRTHPVQASISIIGATVFALSSVGFTEVLGWVTDTTIIPALGEGSRPPRPIDNSRIWLAGVIIVGTALIRVLGVMARRFVGIMGTQRMRRSWFRLLSEHYLTQPLRFFQSRSTGTLMAHTDNDLEMATTALQPLPLSVGTGVLIVAAAVRLAMIDLLLLAIALVLFPLLVYMNRIYSRLVTPPAGRAQTAVGEVSSIVNESLDGAMVIKLLGLERNVSQQLARSAGRLRDERVHMGKMRSTFEPAIDSLPSLGTVALLSVGVWRVSTGTITSGDLVQAMALFQLLGFPMRVLGYLFESLPRAVVARDRIVEVLHDDQLAQFGPTAFRSTGQRLPSVEASPALVVEVDRVSFGFSAQAKVLDQTGLCVDPGETVALVGATGSGKSTLLHLIAGLIRPEDGHIRIGGIPLVDMDPNELRGNLAMVFQEAFLFAESIRHNITSQAHSDSEIEEALRAAGAGFVYDLPEGLDTVVGTRGVTLSGGQRQRVALARALIRQPRVLLLDDATSAVDPLVEAAILKELADNSATTIVVAHRLATITLADRVLFMDRGRIVATGSHDELLGIDAYASLAHAYEHSSSQAGTNE